MSDDGYRDDYEGCVRTYASLNLRRTEGPTRLVTEALGIEPDHVGDARPRFVRDGVVHAARPALWAIRTENLPSTDFRRHLDTLLARLEGTEDALAGLRSQGWGMDVAVYWLSRWGHGGPELFPQQVEALSRLGLGVWFDVYFEPTHDVDEPLKQGEMTENFSRVASHWRRFGTSRPQ